MVAVPVSTLDGSIKSDDRVGLALQPRHATIQNGDAREIPISKWWIIAGGIDLCSKNNQARAVNLDWR